ncbi:hypothetical protein FM037_21870 [Shewanella psychropiezotolerans]|uniref:Uncharacterized protein n=1 Tax=Shewanella psychropiezotolerans TaxID=2593655 RepID=A0ABX5X3V7_9GAMM|nr:hypothetical protein [Shewanella psychropiezotolerans]QDO85412.1 hypothetical protein FM037_21870 [Shewanella psychropiezotolerans]
MNSRDPWKGFIYSRNNIFTRNKSMRPISPLTQQAIASSAIIKPNTNFTVRKITSKSFDFVKKFEFFNTPPQNKSQITKQTQQRLSKLTLNPPPLSKALVTAQLPTEKQATSSRENLPAETIKPMPLKKIEIKQTQEQSSKQTLTPPPPPMPPMPPMPSKAQVIIPLPTEKQSTSSRENLLQEIINHKALKKVETKQTPQPKTSQSAPFDGKLKQSSQSKQSVAQDSSAKLLTPQTHKIKQENTALSFKPELILSETLHQEFFSLPGSNKVP